MPVTKAKIREIAAHIRQADGNVTFIIGAGAGDGVLFIDADANGVLSNSHEYVFTEWAGGSADDLDALRRAFDGVFLLGPATLLLGLGLSLMFSFALELRCPWFQKPKEESTGSRPSSSSRPTHGSAG